jgi:hypothetical protein
MIDVKSLTTDELKNIVTAINRELDIRKQNEINQAIDDFERAFNRLRELRVDIRYCPNDWDDDTVYLRDWDGLSFN